MKQSQYLVLVASIFAAALLVGCTRGANLTIVNRSMTELSNVVATGSGFTQAIGSIPAGGKRRVTVQPTGESGLQLDFNANGKHFTSAPQGYFEAGSQFKVTATVSLDFTVTVDARLR